MPDYIKENYYKAMASKNHNIKLFGIVNRKKTGAILLYKTREERDKEWHDKMLMGDPMKNYMAIQRAFAKVDDVVITFTIKSPSLRYEQ